MELSIVAGCATLAKTAATAVSGLNDLCRRYNEVEDAHDHLIVHTSTLECAMTALSSQMNRRPSIAQSEGFEDRLRASVSTCQRLMGDIDGHVRHVKANAEQVSFKGKFKHIWNEPGVLQWERQLSVQVQALTLLLQISMMQVTRRQLRTP